MTGDQGFPEQRINTKKQSTSPGASEYESVVLSKISLTHESEASKSGSDDPMLLSPGKRTQPAIADEMEDDDDDQAYDDQAYQPQDDTGDEETNDREEEEDGEKDVKPKKRPGRGDIIAVRNTTTASGTAAPEKRKVDSNMYVSVFPPSHY